MALYQSSATNPKAANYMGRMEQKPGIAPAGTIPMSSDKNPLAANYQGVQSNKTNVPLSTIGSVLGSSVDNRRSSGGDGGQTIGGTQNVDYFVNEFGQRQRIEPPSAPSGPSDQELDSAYNPLLDYLNQAESALRSDYPSYGRDIESQYGTSRQQLQNSLQSGQRAVDTQLDTAGRQKMDVISDARRQYNELMMANQQRFGNASSAGQAASELQGREFQRGTAKAEQQYTQLVQELGVKKLEMEQNYQVSLQQLEDKKVAALNEVNRQFQEKILQINQMRANTAAEKANRRLQALQDYKNQTYAVQLQNYQMQQQLQMMKEQSAMELDNYAKQLQLSRGGATSALNSFSSGLMTPAYSQVGSRSVSQAPGMTGQITREEDLTGYAPGLYDRRTGQQIGSSATAQFVN